MPVLDTIVIADDHPLFCQAMCAMLSSAYPDAEVIDVDNIDALREVLDQSALPDLLLLDLNIPGASGFNSLISIVKSCPESPVVVVSGYDDCDTINKAHTHGARGYIPKTIDVKTMLKAIEQIVAGDSWFPSHFQPKVQSELHQKVAMLTPQQHKIAMLFANGLLNKQIAAQLDLSEATVKSHASSIFLKLGVRNRTQAVILLNQLQFNPDEFTADSK